MSQAIKGTAPTDGAYCLVWNWEAEREGKTVVLAALFFSVPDADTEPFVLSCALPAVAAVARECNRVAYDSGALLRQTCKRVAIPAR